MDASAIGAVAALKMTKIPEYTEEEGVSHGKLTDNGLPLTENESLIIGSAGNNICMLAGPRADTAASNKAASVVLVFIYEIPVVVESPPAGMMMMLRTG